MMTSALAMHDHLLRQLLYQHCGYEVQHWCNYIVAGPACCSHIAPVCVSLPFKAEWNIVPCLRPDTQACIPDGQLTRLASGPKCKQTLVQCCSLCGLSPPTTDHCPVLPTAADGLLTYYCAWHVQDHALQRQQCRISPVCAAGCNGG